MSAPDLTKLANKNLKELNSLALEEIQWNDMFALRLNLNDGQSCKVGSNELEESHIFEPTKKITSIETILHKNEYQILQTNFYHFAERLVAVGWDDDSIEYHDVGGRRELFHIADDEQLIGCELNECES